MIWTYLFWINQDWLVYWHQTENVLVQLHIDKIMEQKSLETDVE